jgi:hypothetical protein
MRVANKKARRAKQVTTRLPEVPSWETNIVIHQFISRDSVLIQVFLTTKWQIKKGDSSAEGNNVSKSIRHSTLNQSWS